MPYGFAVILVVLGIHCVADMGMKNKRVIVVGGSGLIGKAVMDFLYAEGAYCLNCDKRGGDVLFDMANPVKIEEIMDFFGVPEVFVNCAYPIDFHAHTWGYLWTTKIVLTAMMNRNIPGSVISFSSIYGIRAPDYSLYEGQDNVNPPSVQYAFEKAGIIGMTAHFAKTYGRYGIRVNCISPGGVFDNQDKTFVERYERRTPLGRMATPEDIVSVVAFLASDASGYITGQNLVVDGGWSL
jgi:NAD(P)-dependent dehydrogenase (short-subunit alcohol dehydrogenase family)